jgi:quinoprotein glucose dehydrogenase
MFKRLHYEGVFTPPSTKESMLYPGLFGMFEWGGLAIDPVRQVAIANPMKMPFVSRLVTRGPGNPDAPTEPDAPGAAVPVQPQYGTPFGTAVKPFLSPVGFPCAAPPWGTIAAIDLRTHKVMWRHRIGTTRDVTFLPLKFKLGVPMLGGPLTTAGGVTFYTGTIDNYLRAFDVETGKMLLEARLPAGGQSTPVTYAVKGKQYVLTAAGGHATLGTTLGDYVVAYTLPSGG